MLLELIGVDEELDCTDEVLDHAVLVVAGAEDVDEPQPVSLHDLLS